MPNPNNKQALIQDIHRAANQVGPVNNSAASARTINQALNPFRQYIMGPQRNSQSVGIYLLDQLSSYRGDSQAIKILQEGYKAIQDPNFNPTLVQLEASSKRYSRIKSSISIPHWCN